MMVEKNFKAFSLDLYLQQLRSSKIVSLGMMTNFYYLYRQNRHMEKYIAIWKFNI